MFRFAGYRAHKSSDEAIGSLLPGLYTDDGNLASVCVIGAFLMATRRKLFAELQEPQVRLAFAELVDQVMVKSPASTPSVSP